MNRRKFLINKLSFLTISIPISVENSFAQISTKFNNNNEPTHNISYYRGQFWKEHFKNLSKGAILADISARSLHYWNEKDTIYKIYPTSVPLTNELTRKGTTKIIKKVVGPGWRPTEEMKKRDPNLPEYMPPGPENPLGTHALYLSWPSYRIHGTSDTRKIGRQSSSGCIGLYNEHIKELFNFVKVGTQVKII